jgi:3-deoxy-7-phosphoheptulonate synthase
MDLLPPREVKKRLSISSLQERFIQKSRLLLQDLVTGKDQRLLIIAGPCSIHDTFSALEYAERFQKLAYSVQDLCVCIMRVYVEKPRTSIGWKGLIYDPHLDGSNDIPTGIFWSRKLFLALTDLKIPIATEIVNPLFLPYLEDLISWGCIGARTSTSQPHREIASKCPFPLGFKNNPDGNIEQTVHAMATAAVAHRFPHVNENGALEICNSRGNPFTHPVLRGSFAETNYDASSVMHTLIAMRLRHIQNRILIDCSHGNCKQNPLEQKTSFQGAFNQFQQGNKNLLGMMLESNLVGGNQKLCGSPLSLKYAVSITDPCLNWSDTEALIYDCYNSLKANQPISVC